jgi:hypothetical protein
VKLTIDKLEATCRKCFNDLMTSLELEEEHLESLWAFLKHMRRIKGSRRSGRPRKADGAAKDGQAPDALIADGLPEDA